MKKIYLILILSFTFQSLKSLAQVPNYVSKTGLQCWYSFNNNLNDLSGRNMHMTTVKGVNYTSGNTVGLNNALTFNGKDENVKINYNFFDNGWKDFTISLWYKITTIDNPNNVLKTHVLFNTGPHHGLSLTVNTNKSKKYELWVGDGAPATSWSRLPGMYSNNEFKAYQWVHLVLVKSDLSYKLYIDKELEKEWTITSPMISHKYAMYFGAADPAASKEALLGDLDEVGIWDRVLRTKEIDLLYEECKLINSHPSDQLVDKNGTAFFNTYSGDPDASYQWQVKYSGTSNWKNLINYPDYIAGAYSIGLQYMQVKESDHNAIYRCMVSTTSCREFSIEAKLTLKNFATNNNQSTQKPTTFPNPSIDYLELNYGFSNKEYVIYNESMLQVCKGLVPINQSKIDISQLSNGFYFLNINNQVSKFEVCH